MATVVVPVLAPLALAAGRWKAVAVFERFTDRARRVLVLAQEEARLLNHSFIGTEHILLGLVHEEEGVAAEALRSLGVTLVAVRRRVEETIGMAGTAPSGSPPFTPRAKKVLELSLREALQLGHSYIGTEHMLLGLVREGEGVAARVLVSLGVDLNRVRQQVIALMSRPGGTEGSPGHGRPPIVGPSLFMAPPSPLRCAMCERDLWEVAHFVTGGDARVCGDCIEAAAGLLEQATPEHRELVLPPRVFGQPPDEAAVPAILDAVRLAFSAAADAATRAGVVEDYDTLERLFADPGRLGVGDDATRVRRLRFLTDDLAEVSVELTVSGGSRVSFEGRVRRRDDRWLLTADTVNDVLGAR